MSHDRTSAASIELPDGAPMSEYQRYIDRLEAMHGWDSVDLVNNCFLLGEEIGELFKAIRRHKKMFEQSGANPLSKEESIEQVGEELVDCMNYLLALANRVGVDMESAFRDKNARNQQRRWDGA